MLIAITFLCKNINKGLKSDPDIHNKAYYVALCAEWMLWFVVGVIFFMMNLVYFIKWGSLIQKVMFLAIQCAFFIFFLWFQYKKEKLRKKI
jgi:Flp pilus assembly protein TadB